MDQPRQYSLPEPLLQQIVNILNELPARIVRPVLNAIEAETAAQDEAPVKTPAPTQGGTS
jgi:hypothetical protein